MGPKEKGVQFEQELGGIVVAVDDSDCIVLHRPLHDHYITVTNVNAVVCALRAAQRFVAREEDRDDRPVLLEIEVTSDEAEALKRWHEGGIGSPVTLAEAGFGTFGIDVAGLIDQLAEAAAS